MAFIWQLSFSQTDTLQKKMLQSGATKTVTTSKKTATLLLNGDRNIGVKLPDLKFSGLTVTATPAGASGTYNISISFTVKNDGSAPVLADNVTIQAFLSDENWLTAGKKDLSMSGFLSAAGGQLLCNAPGKGEVLNPGGAKQISYTLFNKNVAPNPKPIFIINASTGETEIDKSNNLAYTYILL